MEIRALALALSLLFLLAAQAYAAQPTQVPVALFDGSNTTLTFPGKAIAYYTLAGCIYCAKFQPILIDAIEQLGIQDNIPIVIIGQGHPEKVKDSIAPWLAAKSSLYMALDETLQLADIKGFPTLVLYYNGRAQIIQSGCPPNLTPSMLADSIRKYIQ